MRRIAIINQKGGVGKTTTTANLGAALAIQGRRVVVVDVDAQANLSLSLGVEAPNGSATTYSVLSGDCGFGAAIQPSAIPRLALVPANLELSGAELELAAAMGREFILRDALKSWVEAERARTGRSPADYVLFDCPPSLGLLSINALAAAGEVLVTIQTEFLALQGMSKLVEVVGLLKKRLNPELVVTGILPCLYDSRLKLAREVLGEIRSYFRGQVLPHPIRANVKLAEAPSFGQTVFEYAPDSHGATDYMQLAREVLAREERDADLQGLPAFDAGARLAPAVVVPPRKPPPRPLSPARSVPAPVPTSAPAVPATPSARDKKKRSPPAEASAVRPARTTAAAAPPPAVPIGRTAPETAAPEPPRASKSAPATSRKSGPSSKAPATRSSAAEPAARHAEPRAVHTGDVPPLPPDAFEILSILPTDP